MIISDEWIETYLETFKCITSLSREINYTDLYEEHAPKMLAHQASFKHSVFEKIKEGLKKHQLNTAEKKKYLTLALNFGFLDIAKLLIEDSHDLVHEKYGPDNLGISDFVNARIHELQGHELLDKPIFETTNTEIKAIFNYLTIDKQIPLTPVIMQTHIAQNINPRESTENKAVLISIQDTLEKLLKRYHYLDAGAKKPAETKAFQEFSKWVETLKERNNEPVVREALASFTSVINAKVDTENYVESSEKTRETLYGSYRFVVRDTKEKFTMQDIFALIWETIDKNTPKESKKDYLEQWIMTMQEAGEAHDAEKNPIIGFENTTIGCSNAMINNSVSVITSIDTLSKEGIVNINYANPTTMGEKAYCDYLSTWIEEKWKKANVIEQNRLLSALQLWSMSPNEGIPDALYTEETKKYIGEELKKEYSGVIAATELDKNVNDVVEYLSYRSSPPKRIKQLMMNTFVQDFIDFKSPAKNKLELVKQLEHDLQKTGPKKKNPVSLQYKAFSDYMKQKLNGLLLSRSDKEEKKSEKKSYKDLMLNAVKNVAVAIMNKKPPPDRTVAPIRSARATASTTKGSGSKPTPVVTRSTSLHRPTTSSAAKTKKGTPPPPLSQKRS